MDTKEIFTTLLDNLKVDNADKIGERRDQIAKALNREFRALMGSLSNQLMVGSYGRYTAIRGISDLDMLYVLPNSLRDQYESETGPRRVLNRVRDTIRARYTTTEVAVDQCVVRVQFSNFKFEVQPVFEEAEGSFLYPDTVAEKWKVTKPRAEIAETKARDTRTSGNMRKLAKMTRAWRNTHGVVMGGLLIDTLVHRFFTDVTEYDAVGPSSYDKLTRDFFEFLADEDDHEYYLALGSHQRVSVKKRFQSKAKKAYKLCVEAIEAEGKSTVNAKWRAVFGTAVPTAQSALLAAAAPLTFRDTEEFIESRFPVDIRYTLSIDCKVTQNGFRPARLREMLLGRLPLFKDKDLDFEVTVCEVPAPYELKWKVLNRGPEAERRDAIRGEIIASTAPGTRHERTSFRGEHVVECYAIKDGVVVARDHIDVPIRTPEPARHPASA